MIAVGDKPDFNFDITALVAGEEQTQPFASLLGKPTIITVYMRNNTSACDKQNASLAAGEAAIAAKGYQIIAVSRDKCTSHAKYAQKLGISYTLVADPEDRVATALDAVIEKSMYGKKIYGARPSRLSLGCQRYRAGDHPQAEPQGTRRGVDRADRFALVGQQIARGRARAAQPVCGLALDLGQSA
jgi:peroxiredoxin Q/BCP